jgi:hypothetical protein
MGGDCGHLRALFRWVAELGGGGDCDGRRLCFVLAWAGICFFIPGDWDFLLLLMGREFCSMWMAGTFFCIWVAGFLSGRYFWCF